MHWNMEIACIWSVIFVMFCYSNVSFFPERTRSSIFLLYGTETEERGETKGRIGARENEIELFFSVVNKGFRIWDWSIHGLPHSEKKLKPIFSRFNLTLLIFALKMQYFQVLRHRMGWKKCIIHQNCLKLNSLSNESRNMNFW